MLYEHLGEQFAITEEQYAVICRWSKRAVVSRTTINHNWPLDDIRGMFETDPNGFPVHNDVIRDVLIENGYKAEKPPSRKHWYFNISDKSPAVVRWRRYNITF